MQIRIKLQNVKKAANFNDFSFKQNKGTIK